MAKSWLDEPIGTAIPTFGIGDDTYEEYFSHFPHLARRVKNAKSENSAKPQTVLLCDNNLKFHSMTTETVNAFVDHPSVRKTAGTAIPLGRYTKTASSLISYSMFKMVDMKTAIRVSNTTESHHTIRKNTQIAELSVVTLEQSNFIKPVDTAIHCIIPGDDPDLTSYGNELLKTSKLEQQSNTFWFPMSQTQVKLEIILQYRKETWINWTN